MAKGSGITVIDEWAKGHHDWKQWTFRVRDPRRRSYISKAFADGEKDEGWKWAERELAKLRLGLTASGAVPFAAVGQRYVDDLKAAGKSEAYRGEVERLYQAAVAAGAVNMRAEGFALVVRDWLAAAPCFFKSNEQAAPVRPESHRPDLEKLQARLARAEQLVTSCPPNQRKRYARRLDRWRQRVARAKGDEVQVRTPAAITKNRWLVVLKSIGKCAVKHYGLASNPLSAIKPFKVDKNIKTALRVDELRAMVSDAHAGDEYFRQACLMVYTGMRVDEAAHVRWDWIDREARTITIPASLRDEKGQATWTTKGNKARIVPLLDELADLVDGWRAADGAARGWVLGDERLRRLEDKGHWEAFREYLGRCGIDAAARDLSPHCTRHTWTAIMLATGASPNRVRRWLGHAKLETTDIYADAEASFERVVKDWPRAEIRLRRAAAAAATGPGFLLDCDRDPREVLDLFVARGGRLEQLAAAAGVPAVVLRTWMLDGIPDAVRQYLAVMAASARLAAAAAPVALTAAPALAAPLTATSESR